jgi:hypothetical protein
MVDDFTNNVIKRTVLIMSALQYTHFAPGFEKGGNHHSVVRDDVTVQIEEL